MAGIKDFQGKLLISLKDGKNLGEVKDLYLDSTLSRLVGAHIGKEGIINRKSLMVPLEQIKLFGLDAWLVDGSDEVIARDESVLANLLLASSIRGREIQTEGGTKVGTIGDIMIDEKQNVVGFALSKVLAQGPLSESKSIARCSITKLGSDTDPMIANLEAAEKTAVPGV